ncbi:MAG: hypothetical protein KY462_04190 [Actinobacteria bacterium]|nr:hypothetical protein [Actinomycetota bacterium]
MLALAAAVCFLFALFDVRLGAIDFLELGLLLLALHFVFDIGIERFRGWPRGRAGRRP